MKELGIRQAEEAAVLDTFPESCEGPEPNLVDVSEKSASHSERRLKINAGGLTRFSELEDSAFITIHFSSPNKKQYNSYGWNTTLLSNSNLYSKAVEIFLLFQHQINRGKNYKRIAVGKGI